MFENLPDQAGVKYTVSILERAMRDEESARTRLVREGHRLIEDANKALDGRSDRVVREYNPDPQREYNAAVAKVDAMVEILQAMDWAAMEEDDTDTKARAAAFEAWVSELRAKARG